MSAKTDGSFLGARDGVNDLLARAVAADVRGHGRLEAAIDDLLMPEEGRLDDRTRAAVEALLTRLVGTVEAEIRQQAGRSFVSCGEPEAALAMIRTDTSVLPRLGEAGVLRDTGFFRELIARARLELLADSLPGMASDGEAPSLLARLANHNERPVAAAAVTVLLVDSRGKADDGQPRLTELPSELHRRLVWWVTAAVREAHAGDAPDVLDRVLEEAAQHSLSTHDDGDRIEVAAMRLAVALDPRTEDMPDLLTDALADRRAGLFVALLAHGLGIEFAVVRDIVLDTAGDRLWMLLRALGVPRAAIAQIGLALSDADPRRDIEKFADGLDTIAAIDPERARDAIAPLRLDPSFRAALLALARRPAR